MPRLIAKNLPIILSMNGCLVSEDGSSSLDVLHILRKLRSLGFCCGFDHDSDGSCFELILSVFLKELRCKMLIPPFPAMLGDGKPLDLHKLFLLVSEKGGYDSVTANKSWNLVAEGIGLDSAVGCPLKLVYAKYLNALERCLQIVHVKKLGVGGHSGPRESLGTLMNDSEIDARSLFQEILKQKKDGADYIQSPCSKRMHLLSPARKKEPMPLSDNSARDRRNVSDTSGPKLQNGSSNSLKRKRELLVGMLNWVKLLAKNPVDPSIGKFLPSDGLKYGKNMVGEQYSHVLQARKVLFLKKVRNVPTGASNLQSEQQKHPTNGDACNGVPASRLRSSEIPSRLRSCSKPPTFCTAEKAASLIDNAIEVNHLRRTSRNSTSLPDFLDEWVPIRIPIGSSFQAKVPRSTINHPVTSYDSTDLKWLGTRIWPPESHENPPTEPNLVGKGRKDGCNCTNPCSVECVRFHVAERRLQLKRQLGAAFYSWRFHFMGEEVALSWKEEEERIFKAAFRLNLQALGKNFWQQLRLCCPSRGHRSLVSYYFNVFVLALRSYQNRVSPNNVDSDDEETGFGFLSWTFGYGTHKFHEPRPLLCAQNLQCVDLGN